MCLQQHKEHITSTSLKLRQRSREILPTLPWCCIILTNLRATIMSTCFPSCPLLLSYMPCPTTTLKIILLVSFWLQNTIFAFRNASPASEQTTIPADCFFLYIKVSLICLSVYLFTSCASMCIFCQPCKLWASQLTLHLVRVTAVYFCIIPASTYWNESCL